ncbi:MAG: S8 family serine peptidase [Bacteroidetes bacterium]|nr:S8 family serine peptidase [Bacteroidota bacterium]
MKKQYFLFYLICILIATPAFSQSAPGKYFIQFTDKNHNSYTLSNPKQFLSERALERRTKQNIKIDSLDLPVSPYYVAELQKAGAVILHRSKWFNAATIEASPEVMAKINVMPFVRKAYQAPVYHVPVEQKTFQFSRTAQVCEITGADTEPYGAAYYQMKMLHGDALHCAGYTGKGILIGVLDAGFSRVDSFQVFQNLWNKGQITGSYDFVDGGTDVYKSSAHGMFVLSIMGGNLPGKMIGAAPDADYLLIRTEDSRSEFMIEEDNWVAGAEFADSAGVDIINSSLGYTTYDDTTQSHTYQNMDGKTTRVSIGANIAASRGILVVNSAGNSGSGDWQYISAPADGHGVLAVGAVDYLSKYAFFSSIGPSYDGRIKPDVSAKGEGTALASLDDGEVMNGNGTSFSAPIISGMAACLWQAFPHRNRAEIAAAIRQSSNRYPNPDFFYGYGLPDFAKAYKLLKSTEGSTSGNESPIAIYPNPFTNYLELSFKFPEAQNVMVEMFSFDGKKVLSMEFQAEKNTFNRKFLNEPAMLPAGMYIVRIQAGDVSITEKVVKFN